MIGSMLSKSILICCVCVLLAILLLTLVYLLPTQPMFERVAGSICIFEAEGHMPLFVPARVGTKIDNQTDAMMLNIATTKREGLAIEAAMRASYVTYGPYSETNSGKIDDLTRRYEGSQFSEEIRDYTRYWHGYLLFLKPMLLFMEYGGIRMVNMLLQVLLLCLTIYQAARHLDGKYVFALAMGIACLLPSVISVCMQYSAVYYIMLLAEIIVLSRKDFLYEKNRWFYFFLIVGIATNFFDFLTYPAITLGMPLITFLLVTKEDNWKKESAITLCATFSWICGYAFMWMAKWAIGSLITGENVFLNASKAAQIRAGASGGLLYRFLAVWENVKVYICKPYFILMAFILLLVLVLLITKKARLQRCEIPAMRLSLAFLALLPLGWFFIMAEHSHYHCFPHRILSVTIFAVFCYGCSFLTTPTDNQSERESSKKLKNHQKEWLIVK